MYICVSIYMYTQYSKPEQVNLVIRQSLGVILTVADKVPAFMRGFELKDVIIFLQCLFTIPFACPETACDLAGWSHGNGLVYFTTNTMR